MAIPRRKGSNSTILRKIISTVTVAVLSVCIIVSYSIQYPATALSRPNYLSENQTEWTMGMPRNTNGMSRGLQGTNGWYCLYTTQTDRNGSFDVSMMKQASWGSCKSNWKFYGVSKNWTPAEYLDSSYDNGENSNWWLMDGNGRVDPHVSKGQMMSGAYGWAAPRNAVYTVSMDYTAGGGNAEQDGVMCYAEDGVTVSINTSKGVKAKANTPATTASHPNLTSGNLTKRIRLDEGELVYFIADPQKSGGYASATFQISISVSEEEEEDPDDESGDGDGDGSGNGDEAGDNPGDKPDEEKEPEKKPEYTPNGSGNGGPPTGVPAPGNTSQSVVMNADSADKNGKYFIIKGKDLEMYVEENTDERPNPDNENSGGTGETEDSSPTVPLVLIGLLEAIGGGAVLSAGKFFWANK